MSFEDLFETEAPEGPPDSLHVTSDRRGVSWQEQEMLAFGPGESGSAGPDLLPPIPDEPDLDGDIESAARARAGSSWSFGGPHRLAPAPEQRRAWSFGGPDRSGSRWVMSGPSRRF